MYWLHLTARLGKLPQQSWQWHLGTCCLNLLFGIETARPLLKLIGVHTSFEWVCIWTRYSFSPFLLFPEANEQFCEVGVLFNSRIVQLPTGPPSFLYKRNICILKLGKVKECYTQFLHFSRFFFPYFFSFFTELRSCVNGCWLRTLDIKKIHHLPTDQGQN